MEKAPKNATIRYHLGLAYRKNGEADSAKGELREALRLNLEAVYAGEARRLLKEMGRKFAGPRAVSLSRICGSERRIASPPFYLRGLSAAFSRLPTPPSSGPARPRPWASHRSPDSRPPLLPASSGLRGLLPQRFTPLPISDLGPIPSPPGPGGWSTCSRRIPSLSPENQEQLDLATLQKMSGSYVSDDLHDRESGIILMGRIQLSQWAD